MDHFHNLKKDKLNTIVIMFQRERTDKYVRTFKNIKFYLPISSVRPKPPFWFRPDTETETENWP